MSATATLRRVASRPAGVTREATAFLAAVAVVALHVIDDSFVQPQPGTSATDHVVSGLVALALLALAAWAYPRLSGGRRGALALALGMFGAATGIEAVHYSSTVGASGDDYTGLLVLPFAALLLGLGAATLWRTRRNDAPVWRRHGRRALYGVAGFVAFAFVVFPMGFAYVTTHTGRSAVPADELGVAHEDVSFTTSDGLRLEGWYIPSRNGAAVIAFPGRRGPQEKARMLARHGYGVLLFDRRGEGASDGDPHAFGWGGDEDIKAAIAFLQARPDVDGDRIGGIGLSVGGELMIEAAAETPALKAVVSDGAGFRSFREELDTEFTGANAVLGPVAAVMKSAWLAVFSDQAPPDDLRDLVGRISPRPVMLIAAPHSGHAEELNRGYYRAAGEPKTLWEVPEARHMGAQDERPAEYERRVVKFFDEALLADTPGRQ